MAASGVTAQPARVSRIFFARFACLGVIANQGRMDYPRNATNGCYMARVQWKTPARPPLDTRGPDTLARSRHARGLLHSRAVPRRTQAVDRLLATIRCRLTESSTKESDADPARRQNPIPHAVGYRRCRTKTPFAGSRSWIRPFDTGITAPKFPTSLPP